MSTTEAPRPSTWMSNTSTLNRTREVVIPEEYNHYYFWVFVSIEAGAIIIGNLLLCWLFLTHRKLRTKQNFFIISLSVGDLLVGLAIAPCEYCRWQGYTWGTCPVFCGSIISFNMITSVINLLVIACDRYISVEKALKYQKIFSRRRILSIIVGCWMTAILMTVLPLAWSLSPSISMKTKGLINVTFASVMFGFTIIAGLTLFIFYRHIVKMVWVKMRTSNIEKPSNMVGITVCITSTAVFFISWTAYCTIEILVQCEVPVPDAIMDAVTSCCC